MLDNIEANEEFEDMSDPVLENTFADLVDDVVNNPGQIPEKIKDKLSGMEGLLKQESIWARLKELHRVAGVKRKLSDSDWSSSSTGTEFNTFLLQTFANLS